MTAVARVARALVGVGGLRQLGTDALSAIGAALDLSVVAMYVPDAGGAPLLEVFAAWPDGDTRSQVRSALPLDPAAAAFLEASARPLVVRRGDTSIIENPFDPPAEWWVAIPLVTQGVLHGAVFGSSPAAIALEPLTNATIGSIADLLGAGLETYRLRLEAQRTEIQRERLTLMAELHEGLAQDLALAVREVAFLEGGPAPAAAHASIDRLGRAVRAAHRVVRAELEDLAPGVVEPGLPASIASVVERFARRGMDVRLAEPVPSVDLPSTQIAVLTRVLVEALANVEKHAVSAQTVAALRKETDTLVLSVVDTGPGLRGDNGSRIRDGHFGLAIMRAQALSVGGALSVMDTPNGGTTVELRIPLTAPR